MESEQHHIICLLPFTALNPPCFPSATFFYQEGVAGACGKVNSDADFIVSIPDSIYGRNYPPSPLCGATVMITDTTNNRQMRAIVAGECYTCVNETSLDLSEGLFEYFASTDVGLFPSEFFSLFPVGFKFACAIPLNLTRELI